MITTVKKKDVHYSLWDEEKVSQQFWDQWLWYIKSWIVPLRMDLRWNFFFPFCCFFSLLIYRIARPVDPELKKAARRNWSKEQGYYIAEVDLPRRVSILQSNCLERGENFHLSQRSKDGSQVPPGKPSTFKVYLP